ncbi:4Fe-4S dicluster domain-containing protein [Yinghuangia seranimata]|uniref:4Fe-4S dicluster domain-containing protein n=1 Tax=Yinghuangia seranimata TaxID=408067 RepID=UPI00248B37C7|nr:4Fe-4S dicluster domain-containing protein [Yinghuangia seranimata]MDI2130507.1 4Fe-4S dicluster domain-containing protein [Yinghuangia seranimata]
MENVTPAAPTPDPATVLDRTGLDALIRELAARGYTVVGPTERNGAVVLAELAGADELPWGVGTDTDAGRYRTTARADGAAFAHSAGPQPWKRFLHPPRVREWSAERTDQELVFRAETSPAPSYAFLGVRPCDLRAIAVQDRVLAYGARPDSAYTARRRGAFIVAAECTEPGAACFCVSAGGGPAAGPGYDLVLTEVAEPGDHRFWARAGSERGAEVLAVLPGRHADSRTVNAARTAVDAARDRMGRSLPDVDLHALMAGSRGSAHWDDIAQRCLTCGNCTLVCPTCYCTTSEEVTDLTGDHAERWRRWDSCFDLDFSYLHGGPVRSTGADRYRQWLTHKLGTWHDQFGSSGCVGCGRCVVWCPVGIDLTKEIPVFAAERAESAAATGTAPEPRTAAPEHDGGLA